MKVKSALKSLWKVTFVLAIPLFLSLFLVPAPLHHPAGEVDEINYGDGISHTFFDLNGLRLHALVSGPPQHKAQAVLVFLHGFPEFSGMWVNQLQTFGAKGYHCIALDLRGYYLSEKPAGFESYGVHEVAADVAALLRTLSGKDVVLVGHDWGGLAAYTTAVLHPELMMGVSVLNAPHPAALGMLPWKDFLRQMASSWYFFVFQFPYGIDYWIGHDTPAALKEILKGDRPFSEEDLHRHAVALSQPGAIASTLAYYRAVFRNPPKLSNDSRVTVPALLLYGERDVALSAALFEKSVEMCDAVKLVKLPRATHWIVNDAPETVNQEISAFVETVVGGGSWPPHMDATASS